ncbi:MAG: aminotransferase class V-fold PLP-dependent enzyme [Bacteroidia bacterium]
MNWNQIRQDHIKEISSLYLNTASNGLIPHSIQHSMNDEQNKFMKNPSAYRNEFILNSIPSIRKKLASLLNASPEQFALVPNFSIGLNLLLPSLQIQKVGLIKGDYPSLNLPFTESALDVVFLDDLINTDLNSIEQFIIQNNLELLAISHVQWLNGYAIDLHELSQLCKRNNCLLLADATQSFGALEIDLKKSEVDILAASCYKWACAGFGNGFMYIDSEVLDKHRPKSAGFNSTSFLQGNTDYTAGIRSYEPGHHDHEAFKRMQFALDRIIHIGVTNIQARISYFMDLLIGELTRNNIEFVGPFPEKNRSGIVTLESKDGLIDYLNKSGVECVERDKKIRISIHYYNNEADIAEFLKLLLNYSG